MQPMGDPLYGIDGVTFIAFQLMIDTFYVGRGRLGLEGGEGRSGGRVPELPSSCLLPQWLMLA